MGARRVSVPTFLLDVGQEPKRDGDLSCGDTDIATGRRGYPVLPHSTSDDHFLLCCPVTSPF